ncbi:hypothetical protein QMZ92_23845 [Streptomyces sp. HNM0645]|uniref:hypothetical protein n=1 Tax=Streptomyces sp. HNM0645 TaxID=2782343 RepID=UPI0024B72ADB|nr:hypothetical protein [Streptomyces sp. HNM0645]MDI9887319.1 hypothetical protein [Streptomyces sp. HNM0645]
MTAIDVPPTDLLAEVHRLRARVAELEDLVAMARQNVEREQREHAAYRAAHKGSCTHPGCRLRIPHGHSEAARP